MIKYGLEYEAFLQDKRTLKLIVVDKNIYPFDECGLLVEARGEPSCNIIDAVYSLQAQIYKIRQIANKNTHQMLPSPIQKVSRELKVQANRSYDKGVLSYKNIYGFNSHRNSLNEVTAGIHISFTDEQEYYVSYNGINHKQTYFKNFDYIKYIIALDKAFKEEIKKAKRNAGFYELKTDGRIEYRSLPNDVEFTKIIDVIQDVEKNSMVSIGN